MLRSALPPAWASLLAPALDAPWFTELGRFVADERRAGPVFPPAAEVFAALERTPPDRVKVVLMGQDPYHGEGQAHGLALSVRPGVPVPPSLANMFKELASDLGCTIPDNGYLAPWADQGVLLLNAVLTVRAGAAGSHQRRGWERFTDAVLASLAAGRRPIVFALWGTHARKKRKLVDTAPHRVLEGVHPSPLSAHGGFFGSRPFSRINGELVALGHAPIDWQIPSLGVPMAGPARRAPTEAHRARAP